MDRLTAPAAVERDGITEIVGIIIAVGGGGAGYPSVSSSNRQQHRSPGDRGRLCSSSSSGEDEKRLYTIDEDGYEFYPEYDDRYSHLYHGDDAQYSRGAVLSDILSNYTTIKSEGGEDEGGGDEDGAVRGKGGGGGGERQYNNDNTTRTTIQRRRR